MFPLPLLLGLLASLTVSNTLPHYACYRSLFNIMEFFLLSSSPARVRRDLVALDSEYMLKIPTQGRSDLFPGAGSLLKPESRDEEKASLVQRYIKPF